MKLFPPENRWQKFKVKAGIERRPVLRFVHIGKCGGSSVVRALSESPIVSRRFRTVKRWHVRPPNFDTNEQHLIVLRHPVSRAISAFNWRYRLVVDEGRPEHVANEKATLLKYRSLEALASKLYLEGKPNQEAIADYARIHHLDKGMAFYLEPAVAALSADHIFAVLCQETLDADIEAALGVSVAGKERVKENKVGRSSTELSPMSRMNLERFLDEEFRLIEELDRIYPIGKGRLQTLLRREADTIPTS